VLEVQYHVLGAWDFSWRNTSNFSINFLDLIQNIFEIRSPSRMEHTFVSCSMRVMSRTENGNTIRNFTFVLSQQISHPVNN
jgi:hypothetical protein